MGSICEPEPLPKKGHKGGYKQINKALNIDAFEDFLEAQLSKLPQIADVEHISPRCIRVLGQNAGKFTLQGTNTYIIGTGYERIIVDTAQGEPEWAEIIAETLHRAHIKISMVLLTHFHGDHTGGVPDLLRLYPDLRDSVYKHLPDSGQQPIEDGQVFKVEGATVRAVHTPGHSDDHMCFVVEEDDALCTGDNILGHGTAAVEQLSTWMASLRVMKAQGCQRGYPAHGVVIEDLPGKIAVELGQKTRREKQVLAALARLRKAEAARQGGTLKRSRGAVTLGELVTHMHGEGLDPQVRKMAVEPFMEEVLTKLAQDGKVAFEIRGGVKRWFGLEI